MLERGVDSAMDGNDELLRGEGEKRLFVVSIAEMRSNMVGHLLHRPDVAGGEDPDRSRYVDGVKEGRSYVVINMFNHKICG